MRPGTCTFAKEKAPPIKAGLWITNCGTLEAVANLQANRDCFVAVEV